MLDGKRFRYVFMCLEDRCKSSSSGREINMRCGGSTYRRIGSARTWALANFNGQEHVAAAKMEAEKKHMCEHIASLGVLMLSWQGPRSKVRPTWPIRDSLDGNLAGMLPIILAKLLTLRMQRLLVLSRQ